MNLHATEADTKRFMKYVEKLPNGCWFWTGGRSRGKGNRKWYGSFHLGKRTIRAHVYSCEVLKKATCPPDHDRDHNCVFSLCVNPDHLDIVPKRTNHELRMERKMSTTEEPANMSLVLPFEDSSQSFCLGFEAGMVWQRMTQGERVIERPIPYRAENHNLLTRMGAVMGYDLYSVTMSNPEWIEVTFTKQVKPRPFTIVGKAITPLHQFFEMLVNADWFYKMAESQATQERGRKHFAELQAIAKQSEDHSKLYNDFEAYVNDGKEMPKAPEPK